MLLKLHADLSRSNCPQRSSHSKWQAFSLWNEPAIVHVSIRDWQRHQEALAESCASLEDLVRLIDLHAGPLALIAAIQFLITCICRPSSAVPGSSSELSARRRFEQMESNSCTSACHNYPTPMADSGEVALSSSDLASQPVGTCSCTQGTAMCPHCAWQALRSLEPRLATTPSSGSPVTLRTWRLGELQPLAGWRTRDRMSSVRSTHEPPGCGVVLSRLQHLAAFRVQHVIGYHAMERSVLGCRLGAPGPRPRRACMAAPRSCPAEACIACPCTVQSSPIGRRCRRHSRPRSCSPCRGLPPERWESGAHCARGAGWT